MDIPDLSRTNLSPSPKIPFELLALVLEHCYSQPNDLVNAALASKALQVEAERVLYHRISLKTATRTSGFCKTALCSPQRAHYVRYVNCFTPDVAVIPSLHDTLPKLINLEWLCLHPTFSMMELNARCHFSNIQEFYASLEDASGCFDFLVRHPTIKKLHLPFSVRLASNIKASTLPVLASISGGVDTIVRLVPGRPVVDVCLEGYTSGDEAFEVLDACALGSSALRRLSWKGWAISKELIQYMAQSVPRLTSLTIENFSDSRSMIKPVEWLECMMPFKELEELRIVMFGAISSLEVPFEDQAERFSSEVTTKCPALERLFFHDRLYIKRKHDGRTGYRGERRDGMEFVTMKGMIGGSTSLY